MKDNFNVIYQYKDYVLGLIINVKTANVSIWIIVLITNVILDYLIVLLMEQLV